MQDQISTWRNFKLFPHYSAALTFCLELFYICKIKPNTTRMDYPRAKYHFEFYWLCSFSLLNSSLLHLFCLICLLLLIFFCWPFISMYLLRKHFITQTLNQVMFHEMFEMRQLNLAGLFCVSGLQEGVCKVLMGNGRVFQLLLCWVFIL